MLWLIAALQAVTPQTSPDAMAIELAVARYVGKRDTRQRLIGLDDRAQEFATPHAPTGPSFAAYRTRQHLEALAREAGAELVGSRGVVYCVEQPKTGCFESTFRIGVPEQRGDTAMVWLYSFEPRWNSEMDLHLKVVRGGSGWTVVGPTDYREGLFESIVTRRADSLSGCFRFDRPYFVWLGSRPDSASVLHLFSMPAMPDSGLGAAYFLTPIPGPPDSSERHRWWRFSLWREISPDSIYIVWRNGRFGPKFRLRHTPDGLSGTVVQTTDVVGAPATRDRVSATRINCPGQ